MSNSTSEAVAYHSWQRDEEELPTLILGGDAPSLISIPAWPAKKPTVKPNSFDASRRVADVFPFQPDASTPTPRQETHKLSPGWGERLLSSSLALVGAYALLGVSAFWAAWSVSRAL